MRKSFNKIIKAPKGLKSGQIKIRDRVKQGVFKNHNLQFLDSSAEEVDFPDQVSMEISKEIHQEIALDESHEHLKDVANILVNTGGGMDNQELTTSLFSEINPSQRIGKS